ncbi:hypothetical protein [Gemmata massiliana]|uniref:hypothetical protein n=1 Tax=Gemmata massiliana TaxID=1210884 RepID=UPI001E2A9420|nr:hypothetical protein [Gemmata massiliana]
MVPITDAQLPVPVTEEKALEGRLDHVFGIDPVREPRLELAPRRAANRSKTSRAASSSE